MKSLEVAVAVSAGVDMAAEATIGVSGAVPRR